MSLLIFSYLQLLDFMSTTAFLLLGVSEANPMVNFMFSIGPTPMAGLLIIKIVTVLFGVWCWRLGRHRVLVTANLMFALVVAWNLGSVIVGAARIV